MVVYECPSPALCSEPVSDSTFFMLAAFYLLTRVAVNRRSFTGSVLVFFTCPKFSTRSLNHFCATPIWHHELHAWRGSSDCLIRSVFVSVSEPSLPSRLAHFDSARVEPRTANRRGAERQPCASRCVTTCGLEFPCAISLPPTAVAELCAMHTACCMAM